MKAIIQRSCSAQIHVGKDVISQIHKGLVVLVGVEKDDTPEDVAFISNKICNLKLFEDEKGNLGKSVKETSHEVMLVSNFTLCANTEKNRLSFLDAAKPDFAEDLYSLLSSLIERELNATIKRGSFGNYMNVAIENDGPVTIIVDSNYRKKD